MLFHFPEDPSNWYIYLHENHTNQVDVGKYTIHGSSGIFANCFFKSHVVSQKIEIVEDSALPSWLSVSWGAEGTLVMVVTSKITVAMTDPWEFNVGKHNIHRFYGVRLASWNSYITYRVTRKLWCFFPFLKQPSQNLVCCCFLLWYQIWLKHHPLDRRRMGLGSPCFCSPRPLGHHMFGISDSSNMKSERYTKVINK